MSRRLRRVIPILMGLSLAATTVPGIAAAADFPSPLSTDTQGKVEKLPAKYPTGWAFLNYASDRIELRNVGADSREVKAQLQARDSTTLLVSTKRPEIYTADTVWSRGVRGARTDFITIYDAQTLNPAGEIVLPGAKRGLITAMEGMFAFTDEERMALVFNFTPAASVTVVDLVKRQPLGEIEIPGCSLI
jgi:methylamine dehydrogenase heavy chain